MGGDAATYLPAGEAGAWAEAISAAAAASPPSARSAPAPGERAAAFTWERTAEGLLDAYREAAG